MRIPTKKEVSVWANNPIAEDKDGWSRHLSRLDGMMYERVKGSDLTFVLKPVRPEAYELIGVIDPDDPFEDLGLAQQLGRTAKEKK